ncbi:hypothetical protein ACIRYZ_39025 [Kitasatospora sp. NPDC101155]|uniref:hypothetical protein n=1 Tax=Kitasatospora sp. NPDC101155 TaxID=3364097 RepID=UPI0038090150
MKMKQNSNQYVGFEWKTQGGQGRQQLPLNRRSKAYFRRLKRGGVVMIATAGTAAIMWTAGHSPTTPTPQNVTVTQNVTIMQPTVPPH